MLCKSCGNLNPVHSLYCSVCGTKDVPQNWRASCKVCGQGNPVEAMFCRHCGSHYPEPKPEQLGGEIAEMVENRRQMQTLLATGFLTPQEFDIRRLQLVTDHLAKELGKDISKPRKKPHHSRNPPSQRTTRSASSPVFPVFLNKREVL